MKNITAFWPGLGLINVVPHDWPLETYSEKEKTFKKKKILKILKIYEKDKNIAALWPAGSDQCRAT